MVTRRIARSLLAMAARHWPDRLRATTHREWLAELDVLAQQGRHARMLTYAASLVLARPPERSTAAILPAVWRATRLVVVAPLLALALLAGSLTPMHVIVMSLRPGIDAMALQMPLINTFTLVSAVLLARLGRRWTLPGAGLPLLLAVTVPGFVAAVLVTLLSGAPKLLRHLPSYGIFFVGLGLVLLAVHRYAAAGRRRKAWWIGILGAVAVADLAVMPAVLRVDLPPGEAPHPAYAPVWLYTSLTESGFGLPHPTRMEIVTIADVTALDPLLFILYAALAIGAVAASAVRHDDRYRAGLWMPR